MGTRGDLERAYFGLMNDSFHVCNLHQIHRSTSGKNISAANGRELNPIHLPSMKSRAEKEQF